MLRSKRTTLRTVVEFRDMTTDENAEPQLRADQELLQQLRYQWSDNMGNFDLVPNNLESGTDGPALVIAENALLPGTLYE